MFSWFFRNFSPWVFSMVVGAACTLFFVYLTGYQLGLVISKGWTLENAGPIVPGALFMVAYGYLTFKAFRMWMKVNGYSFKGAHGKIDIVSRIWKRVFPS
jgi:hypothetical protein